MTDNDQNKIEQFVDEVRRVHTERGLEFTDDMEQRVRQHVEQIMRIRKKRAQVRAEGAELDRQLAELRKQRNRQLFHLSALVTTVAGSVLALFGASIGTTVLMIACALWVAEGSGARWLPAGLMLSALYAMVAGMPELETMCLLGAVITAMLAPKDKT